MRERWERSHRKLEKGRIMMPACVLFDPPQRQRDLQGRRPGRGDVLCLPRRHHPRAPCLCRCGSFKSTPTAFFRIRERRSCRYGGKRGGNVGRPWEHRWGDGGLRRRRGGDGGPRRRLRGGGAVPGRRGGVSGGDGTGGLGGGGTLRAAGGAGGGAGGAVPRRDAAAAGAVRDARCGDLGTNPLNPRRDAFNGGVAGRVQVRTADFCGSSPSSPPILSLLVDLKFVYGSGVIPSTLNSSHSNIFSLPLSLSLHLT